MTTAFSDLHPLDCSTRGQATARVFISYTGEDLSAHADLITAVLRN